MTTAEYGRLTNPDRWRQSIPEEVFQGLSKWAEGQGFDLTHLRWLTDGQSGAYVAAVQVEPEHGMTHGAILKLLPPELAAKESRGVSLAKQHSAPAFYQAHMVDTQVTGLPGSQWWLHLQELAYEDLTKACTLAELIDDPAFGSHCGTVITAITDEWIGGQVDPKPQKVRFAEFLQNDLGQRLPRLKAFATQGKLDPERPEPTVMFPHRAEPLPNPFAILTGVVGGTTHAALFTGNGHGDLHPGNIFISTTSADTFRLIDFGRFSPATPISRDPAKLQLSTGGLWLPDLAPYSRLRSRLADLMVTPHRCRQSAALSGYLQVIQSIYDAASAWGKRRRLSEAWTHQHMLVLLASALRAVASIGRDIADRWWFFEVAAVAARELIAGSPATRNTPLLSPLPSVGLPSPEWSDYSNDSRLLLRPLFAT